MEIKVTASTSIPDFADHANNALRHALGSARIADLLEKHDSSVVEESDVLTQLFRRRTTILSGPTEFGGAIKGYALIGYLEYHQAAKLTSLYDTGKIDEVKRNFLRSKGLGDELLKELDDGLIALWEAYHTSAMVAPTSGSFGLTAYETVQKLRELKIKGRDILLFGEGEVAARAWVPAAELGIMTPDKHEFIVQTAASINCDIMFWNVRETRDHYALLDAIMHDHYFCPTNPKTKQELAKLLDEVIKGEFDGKKIFEGDFEQLRLNLIEKLRHGDRAMTATLKKFGIKIHHHEDDLNVVAQRPVSAGRYGLMLARLDHWEYLIKTSGKGAIDNETFNQPSIGATLAGAGEVDRIILHAMNGNLKLSQENIELLHEQYPYIAKQIAAHSNNLSMKLYATPDACNLTLCDQLGMTGDRPETMGLSPANGLGTITPGDEPADVLKGCKGTSLQSNYLVATKPWMAVAQALIFLHEVQMKRPVPRFPEEAGAASLAGYLREQHKTGALAIDDIVFALRNNGFDGQVFEEMLVTQHGATRDRPWDVLYNLENAHGAAEKSFVGDLERAFCKSFDDLNPKIVPIDHDKSLTFYSTGYNGTNKIAMALQTAIKRNETEIVFEAASQPDEKPLSGFGSAMMLPLKAVNRIVGAAML